MTVLDEVVHHGPAGLAASTGDHDRLIVSPPVNACDSVTRDQIGRVFEPGLDRHECPAPLFEPGPEDPASFGRQQLRLDRRTGLAIRHRRGRGHSLDQRDMPAVLGPDRPEDDPDLARGRWRPRAPR